MVDGGVSVHADVQNITSILPSNKVPNVSGMQRITSERGNDDSEPPAKSLKVEWHDKNSTDNETSEVRKSEVRALPPAAGATLQQI